MNGSSKIAGLVALLAALLPAGCGAAAAADAGDLYQAQTIVTGQEEANRRRGFAACLKDVLVKVSGDPRLTGDPRVAAMAGQAHALVSGFGYRDRMSGIPVHDEQGTRDRPYDLTVSFDPAKIDAALRALGRAPWPAQRPRVVMFLGVRNGATAYLLAADGERGRDQRDALAAAARQTGLPVVLPGRAALAGAGLSVETLPSADLPGLEAAAKTIGGDLALAGGLVWSAESLGWIAEWRLGAEGRTYRWGIRGVSFDDAFRNAVRGAAQILSGHGEPGQGLVDAPP